MPDLATGTCDATEHGWVEKQGHTHDALRQLDRRRDRAYNRCGFPKKRNFKFLETLQLKTVLTLVLEDYPEANLEWCQQQDIQFMVSLERLPATHCSEQADISQQFGIPGNKEPFDNIPEDVIASALVAILDRRNHPILIHCNKGKHRTGCLIGCIRRLQSWSLTSIFDE